METRPTSLLGSWEGVRSVQAAGWQWGGVGTMGEVTPCPVLGTPSGFGVFIPTVAGTDSSFHPAGAPTSLAALVVSLSPRAQPWCAQWVQTHRTPGGTDPPPSCPLPLLSKSKSLLPVSIPWTPADHPLSVPTGPVVSIGVPAPSGCSQGDTVPPVPSVRAALPPRWARCSRWCR